MKLKITIKYSVSQASHTFELGPVETADLTEALLGEAPWPVTAVLDTPTGTKKLTIEEDEIEGEMAT